jgi:hypothetical protein
MGMFDGIRAARSTGDVAKHAERIAEVGAAEPLPGGALRAITASGKRIDLKSEDDIAELRYRAHAEWQDDAWAYYDAIGEIKFGFNMLAAVFSRIRLYSALNIDADSVPVSTLNYRRRQVDLNDREKEDDFLSELQVPSEVTPDVMEYMEELVADLGTGPGGMSGFMRGYCINAQVPGEVYLVKIDNQWCMKSCDELVVNAAGEVILRRQRSNASSTNAGTGTGVSGDKKLDVDKTELTRIWREHPRYSLEAESSMLGLREACDELLTLQRMIRAVARSNMNAGVFLVPDGLAAAGQSVAEDAATEEELAEELVQTLYDQFTAGVIDETNFATVVPTILTGPATSLKEVRWMDISRQVDQYLTERCDRALERILQGIDMPKDFVTGLANVRYTNAKSIDESLYKSHIEPLVLMLVDALNVGYFRPALRAKFGDGLPEKVIRMLTIWYDPSEVVTKADPAESADKGFDKFVLSADAWRQAHGFADTDAPSEKELAQRLLFKGNLAPEQMNVLFEHAFPEIVKDQRSASMAKNPGGFPESAREAFYPDDDAQEPEEKPVDAGGAPSATPIEGGMDVEPYESIAASALMRRPRGLYAIPYDGNDMQERYRAIAEHAIRSGDCDNVTFNTSDLTPTQSAERSSTRGTGAGAKDLRLPIVITHGDTDYLLDGHHRALRRRKIVAHYVDVDNLRTNFEDAV